MGTQKKVQPILFREKRWAVREFFAEFYISPVSWYGCVEKKVEIYSRERDHLTKGMSGIVWSTGEVAMLQ